MKKEKSPPEVKRPQTGRECNNKGTDCSALDVTVLFQVVHEMLRRIGPHRHPVQFPVPPGEIHHVLPVGAPAVKPAALTQDAYKLGRAEAAILPPSAKIPDLVFFIIGISNVSKASLTGYHPG
jgi:hypothetical protein